MRVGNRQHGSFIRTCGRFIHDSSRSASMCWSFKHNGTNTMERVTGDLSNAQAQRVTAKPNIVFILADDMRKDDMEFMPKAHSLLGEQGMGFRNAFVSDPLCAPSRSSIMRGQYSTTPASGPTPPQTAPPPPSVVGKPTGTMETKQT